MHPGASLGKYDESEHFPVRGSASPVWGWALPAAPLILVAQGSQEAGMRQRRKAKLETGLKHIMFKQLLYEVT